MRFHDPNRAPCCSHFISLKMGIANDATASAGGDSSAAEGDLRSLGRHGNKRIPQIRFSDSLPANSKANVRSPLAGEWSVVRPDEANVQRTRCFLMHANYGFNKQRHHPNESYPWRPRISGSQESRSATFPTTAWNRFGLWSLQHKDGDTGVSFGLVLVSLILSTGGGFPCLKLIPPSQEEDATLAA
ncbi:methyltransferase [Anopheles sinensis]|uniref:Methyltransferase n=1 Tax=Anopheles sinensis TaxID=74873 RepID=A0A084VDA6_ANOSI|nr:methyltransferase [Anopheles sinensis]